MESEQRSRAKIHELLKAAGWALEDKEEFDCFAASGGAVREFALPEGETA